MARDFDGTNDQIGFGSDASIDAFTTRTVSYWGRHDAASGAFDAVFYKGNTAFGAAWNTFSSPPVLYLFQGYDAGANERAWSNDGVGNPAVGAIAHICWTFDNSGSTNDPILYVNGATQTVVESGSGGTTPVSDAASNAQLGEDNGGASDFDGAIGWFCYDNAIWTAAQVNRARWWGRPGGGVTVYHPLVTDKLANEGTATANGTATGTTVASLVTPVQRPGMGTAL